MPVWIAKSRDLSYEVTIGESSRQHAETVVRTLNDAEDTPDDFYLVQVGNDKSDEQTHWWNRL